MVGRAKSDTKKTQISRSHHDEWMTIAVDRYHEERAEARSRSHACELDEDETRQRIMGEDHRREAEFKGVSTCRGMMIRVRLLPPSL
jgi:ubiquitin C-terminal hydrolase